jgi:hypothetical protein
MRQAYDITGKLRDASTAAVQNLIDGWDLVEMLMKVDPTKVNREAFAASLVPSVPAIFSTPQEILGYFVFYAGNQGWPVTGLINQLTEQMPTNHVSTLDHLLTLDIWLGDLPTTFEALAGWIKYQQAQIGNGFWRWDNLKSGVEQLRLLNPKRCGKKPSVKWVELDMTANRGSCPKDVRDPKVSAGLQVMTAFAVHPNYPPSIDYDTIPGARMAGLQATIPGYEAWAHVPVLYWVRSNREVSLHASWDDRRYDYYAVPVCREL